MSNSSWKAIRATRMWASRLALYFQRVAPTVTSEVGILADPNLLQVAATIMGLPPSAAADLQPQTLSELMPLSDLQDPAKLNQLTERFTAMYDYTYPRAFRGVRRFGEDLRPHRRTAADPAEDRSGRQGRLYAADFFRDLAGAGARLGLADDPADYKLLSSAVAALPPDGRREFLLTLAKSGVVSAHFAAAAAAATEALESSKADSPEAMRARLYLAASRLFSDAYDAAIADLRALPAAKLDRADAGLLPAARRVAAELRIAPDLGVVNTQSAAALPDADKDKPNGPALTIAQAQAALQRTSSLAPTQDGGSQ
jgi:hypothetical protein